MSDFSEILEMEEPKNQKTPEMVRVLAILSYIGNGFWILAFLAIVMVISSDASIFDELLGNRVDRNAVATIFTVALGIAFILGVLCIYGAYKMYRGFKSGFIFYAIGNSLWALLLLIGTINGGQNSNYLVLLISIGFIVGFGSQLKNLR